VRLQAGQRITMIVGGLAVVWAITLVATVLSQSAIGLSCISQPASPGTATARRPCIRQLIPAGGCRLRAVGGDSRQVRMCPGSLRRGANGAPARCRRTGLASVTLHGQEA